MEKEVFNTKYVVATYNKETGIYFSKFLPETDNIRDQEWKELMESHVKVIEKNKPKYIIDDNTDRLFAYPPQMQAWMLKLYIYSWNKIGLKKYVQILPENIIVKISAEQIKEMANTEFKPIFKNHFVASYVEAVDWINESDLKTT